MMRTIYNPAVWGLAISLFASAEAVAQEKESSHATPAVSPQKETSAADSLRTIVKEAEKGNAAAQNIVGAWYYKGEHYAKDYKKALKWWSEAAARKNNTAIGNLGLLYQFGQGVDKDSVKALKYYLHSIQNGNKELLRHHEALAEKTGSNFSRVLCAVCYQEGKGTEKDRHRAVQFYRQAARDHSADALRELAFISQRDKDEQKAAGLFRKAAEMGDLTSAYQYAKLALRSTVPADTQNAVSYLVKAAEAGQAQAQYDLAQLYLKGKSVAKDERNAVGWFRKSAAAGWAPAAWNLALCLIDGTGTERNYSQALYWLGQANASGYGQQIKKKNEESDKGWAGTSFGTYLKGMSLYYSETPDADGAYEAFRRIRKESVEARIMMAACLGHPNFRKSNTQKAVKELGKLAGEGQAMASYLLGKFHETGNGTEKNSDKAAELYLKAAEGGYAPAQCRVGDLYYTGRLFRQSYADAVRYYRMANEQGWLTETAAGHYALCLEKGLGGLKRDAAQAARLREKDFKDKVIPLLRNLK